MVRPTMIAAAVLSAAFVTARAADGPRALAVAAVSGPALASWDARTSAMLQTGRLELVGTWADSLVDGRVHERLEQRHDGLPVFGAVLMRQSDGLAVRSVFGRLYDNVHADGPVRVDAETAGASAVAASAHEGAVVSGEAILGVLPMATDYALAWRVPVRSQRDVRVVFVDAVTGRVLRSDSRLRSQLGPVGRGRGVFGDEKKISTRRSLGGYETRDTARPAPIETYDFNGAGSVLDRFLTTGLLLPGDLARDLDNDWADGAVVDAHVYQGWVYDYFFKRFSRGGMDGRNGPTASVVHPLARAEAGALEEDDVGLFVNNALYVGGGQMIFGDGDGQTFGWFAGALDVVAHEWTHGVTEYTSDLDYRDEAGALNESFSDIMGAAVEFYFQPPGSGPQRADWLIGEDVTLRAPGYIRSLADPAAAGHPDHYSLVRYIGTDIDNGGIHLNASVPNHAFYLAVAGGRNRVSGITVDGIGAANVERMERVFYRAFTSFLTPGARFSDARAATLQAASELYGADSAERVQIERAWTAVGVN